MCHHVNTCADTLSAGDLLPYKWLQQGRFTTLCTHDEGRPERRGDLAAHLLQVGKPTPLPLCL